MRLRRLELVDFRSYRRAVVEFEAGVNVLAGQNGHGKTNLLEAVYRLAVGASHRVAGDAPLVRAGATRAVIRATADADDGRRRTVDLELAPGRGGRAVVDGAQTRRTLTAVGVLRAVIVAPEDLEILRGDPAGRRRFLDDLLVQRRPSLAGSLADYDRALRQRNALLRQARGLTAPARRAALDTVASWTDQLIGHGAQVVSARTAATAALRERIGDRYRFLADRDHEIGLRYRCSTDHVDVEAITPAQAADRLRQASDAVADRELDRGVTLVGPHRDDLEIAIDDLPARGYASHGELWSLLIALRLAAHRVVSEVGDEPVLLLDDVFAELDRDRRDRLADLCKEFDQVIVTTPVGGDVPLSGVWRQVTLTADHGSVVSSGDGS